MSLVLRFRVKSSTASQEELSMTKKETCLGEVVVLHSPSLVWWVEEVRKAGRAKCNGVERLE